MSVIHVFTLNIHLTATHPQRAQHKWEYCKSVGHYKTSSVTATTKGQGRRITVKIYLSETQGLENTTSANVQVSANIYKQALQTTMTSRGYYNQSSTINILEAQLVAEMRVQNMGTCLDTQKSFLAHQHRLPPTLPNNNLEAQLRHPRIPLNTKNTPKAISCFPRNPQHHRP